jgi:DUF2933 family protein
VENPIQSRSVSTRWVSRVLLILFLGIAAFFLWTEHRAHLLGALPWILLIACCALLAFGLYDYHKHRGDGDETHRRAS